jgi:L-fuculose-phosphate aldolase
VEQVMGAPSEAAGDPRAEIVKACKILYAADQGDMVWGHVSVRAGDGRGVWLKGAGLGIEEVTVEDVILLSWDGEILEGSGRRHQEWPIHTQIMLRRPEVNAVVHTHPLYAVAFAATGWELTQLSHEGQHFVPPDIPRFTRTSDIVETVELGESLADSIGSELAVLMPHHGITTAAASLGDAVAAAVQLDRACQVALLAGKDAIPASHEDSLQKRKRSPDRLRNVWTYLSRKVA